MARRRKRSIRRIRYTTRKGRKNPSFSLKTLLLLGGGAALAWYLYQNYMNNTATPIMTALPGAVPSATNLNVPVPVSTTGSLALPPIVVSPVPATGPILAGAPTSQVAATAGLGGIFSSRYGMGSLS